ncbi:MAG: dephospho-CoA kinase [Lentisphaerae bacterium]|jgi:dephospho-CoA kinase|nr:dephospho-CoA kinase [Lentisphaerota bacterium]MBT4818096.1 dephospho-CoA kinase [Lentisphaerota bacterium]MBT5610054.1 dephospho-CoA kinase [Lentisphaerota bacterium]MBT7055546.1 dephospho-CoA kinase [Lentisphaerota bacterium]MBT7841499.1 dephospho-CoA kinase [Lentisphaerota bacterium]
MHLVGVTGGIGAGKTTVLRHLHSFNARTVDADTLVHELYAPGTRVFRGVLRRWGSDVTTVNGDIDRAAVARLVFADKDELEWLNRLVHPCVRQRIREIAEQQPTPLFCAIPLLFEVGWERDIRTTISVWCPPETQRSRLRSRGWTDEHIDERLAHQLSMDEKLRRADYGIINNGSQEMLREQCIAVYQRVMTDMAKGRRNAKN